MLRLFFENVLRSLIYSAVAVAFACIVNVAVFYAFDALFHQTLPIYWVYIVLAIAATEFAIFVIFNLAKKACNYFIRPFDTYDEDSYWIKRIRKGKKIKAFVLSLMLFLHFIAGGGLVYLLVIKYTAIVELIESNSQSAWMNGGVYALSALVAVAWTQIRYFIKYNGYYEDMKCPKCKHTLCMLSGGLHSITDYDDVEIQSRAGHKHYELTDDTGRIHSFNNGAEQRTRVTTNRTSYFDCRCAICGGHDLHTEERKKRSNWSEYK